MATLIANLRGPQGQQGNTGPQGNPGGTGPAGPPGADAPAMIIDPFTAAWNDPGGPAVTGTSMANLITPFPLGLNSAAEIAAALGSMWRLTVWGLGTYASGLQLNMQLIAGSNQWQQASVSGLAIGVFRFRWESDLHLRQSQPGNHSFFLMQALTASPFQLANPGNSATVLTMPAESFQTSSNAPTIGLQASWSSTTGTPTVRAMHATFQRLRTVART